MVLLRGESQVNNTTMSNKNFEKRKAYPTDVTDRQWEMIKGLAERTPKRKRKSNAGRKRCNPREIWNAINYVCQTGCRWEDLPHDFGCSYSVARKSLRKLKYSGKLKQIFENVKQKTVKKN